MQTLEQRINSANIDKQQFIAALLSEVLIPGRDFDGDYYKHQTADRIKEFYEEKGIYLVQREKGTNVSNFFYTAMNKEPLQRIVYGIKNSQEIPNELWPELTDWEAAYFLAGLWNKKANKNYGAELLKEMPIHLIVYGTIYDGINSLKRRHEEMKDKGEYVTSIELPYADELLSYDQQYKEFLRKYRVEHGMNVDEQETRASLAAEIRKITARNAEKLAKEQRNGAAKAKLQPTLF